MDLSGSTSVARFLTIFISKTNCGIYYPIYIPTIMGTFNTPLNTILGILYPPYPPNIHCEKTAIIFRTIHGDHNSGRFLHCHGAMPQARKRVVSHGPTASLPGWSLPCSSPSQSLERPSVGSCGAMVSPAEQDVYMSSLNVFKCL